MRPLITSVDPTSTREEMKAIETEVKKSEVVYGTALRSVITQKTDLISQILSQFQESTDSKIETGLPGKQSR